MKKISLIFSIIGVTAFLASCDTDQLLDVENRNATSVENFWSSQIDAESGIAAVYSSLQFSGVLGSNGLTSIALQSTTGRVGNVNQRAENREFDEALVTPANPKVFEQWEDLYKIVFRANQVLENVPGIDMDEQVKKEILGEAYFLRGLAMFWVATTFNNGRVPYPLKPPTNLEESRFSVKERNIVYGQIIEDLIQAQTNLEDRFSWKSDEFEGRATWGAATSILGKVYLYESEFALARDEFEKVIDSGIYSLVPDIVDNFNEEGEHNRESIFEVPFYANLSNSGNLGDGEGFLPDESTARAQQWARKSGQGLVFSTHFISSLYRNEVIDPSLPMNQGLVTKYLEGYDPDASPEQNAPFIVEQPRTSSHRSDASIAYEKDGSLFYGNSTSVDFIRVVSRTQIRKFANWKLKVEITNSGINERIIRLADVYLMYAEAILREGGPINEALTYINLVRQRSGLVTLETLFQGISPSPIAKNTFQGISDAQALSITNTLNPSLRITSQALTAENILLHLFNKERPAEFAWEGRGISWQDLRRRPDGRTIERIQELGAVDYQFVTFDPQAFEISNKPFFLMDFLVAKERFDANDFFYPLPSREILQNPSLTN